jgi:hypothetical protein
MFKYTKYSYHLSIKPFSFVSPPNKKFSSKTFELVLPTMNKLTIEIDKTKTLKDLETEIKKNYNFEKIEFRTWDNSNLSKNNELNLIRSESDPIFMKINTAEWQILNAKNFEYTTTEHNVIQKHLVHNEKSDFELISKTLKNFNKNTNLTDKEFEEISMNLLKIKHSYNNRESNAALQKYKNLYEVFSAFYKLKQEFASLHSIKEKLMWICETKAKILILLGGLLFLLELYLIYYGTFIKFSWDIVEPITYLVGCSNIVIILLYRRKFKEAGAFEYYSNKFFMRQVRKKKFDLIKFEETQKKLKELEMILNR